MSDTVYERVNDFTGVKITLASPNDIRAWSYGEVKKPETINYRTYRPEKDGLFCERIFGPERDYECACGKYRGTKYKGIICDRCGVKVTHSRVRRKRMGHINLAAPVVHIWFFKSMPSRLGTLLGMKTSDLEKVIYYQDYVVVDPGDTDLKPRQILTEDDHRANVDKYGNAFRALMGADAIRELIERLDLANEAEQLRTELRETRSKQKIKDYAKRLKLIEQVRGSENHPAWLVMDVIPVIPPDLRPLVLLESGNFATSDLNDLYRRIINRNNRLKKLMDLNAPEVIIRNEKRMLQQAVDALFDNGRCRRPVLGSSNRPLKSLTDMIKGKQGRFRENLLGKRVDYSARSVIVVGPELKLHQCGLPKKIALELYQPFIIRKLKEQGLADTIKSAKRMLERRDAEVWDILEQVIYQHPVLLNRAPTLHRMGIQAFEPVLVEGNAIRIHPLVCGGFNADFDGDQMAVHLPLSIEAQAEAHVLMLSTHNIFSPANGKPIISASQDIVMGVYFLTTEVPDSRPVEQLRSFKDRHEAILAYEQGVIDIHEFVTVRIEEFRKIVSSQGGAPADFPASRRIRTTVGRVLFSDIIEEAKRIARREWTTELGLAATDERRAECRQRLEQVEHMPYYNCALGKKGCARVIDDVYDLCGRPATIELLDLMKEIGFKQSTLAGLSFGVYDMRIPAEKSELLAEAQRRVDRVEKNYDRGIITHRERYNQLLDIWAHCREEVTTKLIETLRHDRRDENGEYADIASGAGRHYLNPVYLMSDSGARGNISQMMQLAGMRGLMAKPSGEIIETPIRANFREGLNILEYFSSTHGARKGLADTALKTADSGYLTRKLCDIAQSVIVGEHDCGSRRGIVKRAIYKGDEIDVPLRDQIEGRVSLNNIVNPMYDTQIVRENEIITREIAKKIEELGIEAVYVRSPLTSESSTGCSVMDYGLDMSTGKPVEIGMAVGIIAAQSIGEPGTQLTMRTFHTGGIGTRSVAESEYRAGVAGTVVIRDCSEAPVTDEDGREVLVSLKRNGEIAIFDAKGREVEKFKVPYGGFILVKPGQEVKKGQELVKWDPHRTPTLAEKPGRVQFVDIVLGETYREEDAGHGRDKAKVVIEHKGDLHPQINIVDAQGNILDFHYLPAKARIEVKDGQEVQAGHMLARQPRAAGGSQDIVGGLPRVTEIFEARKPKDPAYVAEITGRVELLSDKRKGKMTIRITSDSGIEKDHHVLSDKHLLVHGGDFVQAGDPLTEGPLVPHDILRIKGEEALWTYMLDEVQNVYRAQGVTINDKHIELILSQMLRKVKIENTGDTDLLPQEVVDKFQFRQTNNKIASMLRVVESGGTDLRVGELVHKDVVKEANAKAEAEGKEPAKTKRARPATGRTLLLGITKASLQSESFLSGASFQETTKVLTEAALKGAEDTLVGLKENVLLGHLIPAGTGFRLYQDLRVKYLAEPPKDDLDEEAEMLAEAARAAEALGANRNDSLGVPHVEVRSDLVGERAEAARDN
ncbi:MAG: DNA-directed RNA polymerase subunit beta' [Leptolyngbya sp. PLA2]|nr:DNA-directed RNA polymerase subunit beta' [Leptolyngbya sp.]MCE7971363.1 DNA-directed RNA polymerase subunit beta' [Leptolyngbya sp. PL-A2]MDL1903549.1 DNA-directed RNA polymerase subunit beta' [Synechococcales cyanobacterium CNB]